MKSPDESTSNTESERGEVVIPVHEYVKGDSLAKEELNTEIHRLLALGVNRFALDFGGFTGNDSPSIGILIQAHTIVQDRPGEWRIINLPRRVKDAFDVVNISGLF